MNSLRERLRSGEDVEAVTKSFVSELKSQFSVPNLHAPATNAVVSEMIGIMGVMLLKHIVELEQKSALTYLGVYQRAQSYGKGNMVSQDGSLFIALRNVEALEQPGQSTAWQLAVKSGRGG